MITLSSEQLSFLDKWSTYYGKLSFGHFGCKHDDWYLSMMKDVLHKFDNEFFTSSLMSNTYLDIYCHSFFDTYVLAHSYFSLRGKSKLRTFLQFLLINFLFIRSFLVNDYGYSFDSLSFSLPVNYKPSLVEHKSSGRFSLVLSKSSVL